MKASQAMDVQQDGFMFDILTNGSKPYISLSTLYEALEEDEVILSFEYSSEADINNGRFMYETPNFHTDVYEEVPVLPAAAGLCCPGLRCSAECRDHGPADAGHPAGCSAALC